MRAHRRVDEAARQPCNSLTLVAIKPPRSCPRAELERTAVTGFQAGDGLLDGGQAAAAGVMGWAGITTSMSGLCSATRPPSVAP